MKILVAIPAKSDSNRLKNKNMSKIRNKIFIGTTVKYAKNSKKIANRVVSKILAKLLNRLNQNRFVFLWTIIK